VQTGETIWPIVDLTASMRRLGWIAIFVCLQVGCMRSPRYYVEQGNRQMAAGKYTDAEIQYRKSILKDPGFAEAYYRLGVLEYKLRRGLEALHAFQQAMSLSPGNEVYGIELASVAIEAYQVMPEKKYLYQQAAQEAEFLLKKDPNSFDGLRLKGDVAVIDRKYDEALADFQKANRVRPNDPDLMLAMAQVLFVEKQDGEGEELLQQLLKARKDYQPIYDLLETHYIRSKRAEDAEHLLQSEIDALPRSAHPRMRLAQLYRTAGRDQEMAEELKTISADPSAFPDGAAQVGDFYAELGRWDEALAQYRAGLKRWPRSDQVLYHKRMERAFEALGKRQEALAELNEILKTNPQDAGARLTRAVLLRNSQDPKEQGSAGEELKSLSAQYPQDAAVSYNLALWYRAKGDAAAAAQQARKSKDLSKDYVAPRLLLAEIEQKAQHYPEALEAAQEVLALDPNNTDARLLRAAVLVEDKSYREAESELSALSKLQPNSEDVDLGFAALAEAQRDYPKAEVLYRRIYRRGSQDLRPLRGLIQLCVLERRPEQAQTLLEDELKHEPDSRPVRLLLASVATDEGKLDLAARQYRWLQSKDPNSAQPYSALGDLYQRQGNTADALASYKKALELAPNDPKTLNAIAVLESNDGQTRQAIATLTKELALDPDNGAAMNNLAFNLAETGQDLDHALNLAQNVAGKFPENPAVIDTLGWVYARRGMNASAIQVLRGLVNKYPNEPAYHYHLATALLHDKQTSDAKRQLLAALSQHPSRELETKIQQDLAQVH
jgi:tetratricopeptide (TPR) repeat protein